MIKEQALSRNDLAKIWNASCGKHEAIEKNVHDLLAKLAWDFSPEQLEQLFDCFRVKFIAPKKNLQIISFFLQESWTKASKKQREKLLELIRRLAEDDKEGLMANKVKLNKSIQKNFFFFDLNRFWNYYGIFHMINIYQMKLSIKHQQHI